MCSLKLLPQALNAYQTLVAVVCNSTGLSHTRSTRRNDSVHRRPCSYMPLSTGIVSGRHRAALATRVRPKRLSGLLAADLSIQLSASENVQANELIPVLLEQIGTDKRIKDEFR